MVTREASIELAALYGKIDELDAQRVRLIGDGTGRLLASRILNALELDRLVTHETISARLREQMLALALDAIAEEVAKCRARIGELGGE